jgi:hypothetical protein
VRKAVESINKLGNDFKIITQGDKHSKRLICSVSVELDQDHMALLKAAENSQGQITFSTLQKQGYSAERFKRAINRLL